MKYRIIGVLIFVFVMVGSVGTAHTARVPDLAGEIVVQTDGSKGMWYISPRDKSRYYAKNDAELFAIASQQSIGISSKDIKKIPLSAKQKADKKLVQRLKGLFVLQVEDKGQMWYINPTNGIRYYVKDAQALRDLMLKIGVKEKGVVIASYAMNRMQNIQDPIFNDVAYVAYSNGEFTHAKNADELLPFASLSKLMTALVLKEIVSDWDTHVIMTQEEIEYPWHYAEKGTTSEINLKAGDTVALRDLWSAMLIASSNQATITLVDASGMDRESFVRRMNEKSKDIGMLATTFFDPTGLDPRTIGTAKDMARLAHIAFEDSRIAQTSATKDTIVISVVNGEIERKVSIKNRNTSLLAFEPSASKTGFLTEAQRTVALKKNSSIIVVLHARSMNERNTVIKYLIDGAQTIAVN